MNELARHDPVSISTTQFDPKGFEQAVELSKILARSQLIPSALRGKSDDVLIVLITGRELGLSSMQALRSISVIEGKPCLGADAMVGLVQSHPDVCEYFRLVSSDDSKAVYETKRKGHSEPVRMSFTIEQAKAAGLTGKQNWQRWGAAMLRARCSSHLARAVYPDLVAGIYNSDEGEEIRESAARVVNTPEPVKVARAPSACDALVAEIGRTVSLEALKALVPRLQALSNGDKEIARAAYGERQAVLRAQDRQVEDAVVEEPEPAQPAEEPAQQEAQPAQDNPPTEPLKGTGEFAEWLSEKLKQAPDMRSLTALARRKVDCPTESHADVLAAFNSRRAELTKADK